MNKYVILQSASYSKLEEMVNEWMDAGYVPVGGIEISAHGHSFRYFEYFQSMVQKDAS